MDFNAQNYYLILGQEGEPIIENGKLLLQNIRDHNMLYVTITPELLTEFGIERSEEIVDDTLPGTSTKDSINSVCSFSWNNKSTLLFLDEYRKRHDKFRDPKYKKKLLWADISKEMKLKGYDVDGEALDRKMRNMKHTYKTIVDNNNKKKSTGKGRIDWEYFKVFNDIFCEDRSVNLSSICMSSIPSATTENNNLCSSIENLSETQDQNLTNLNEQENTTLKSPSTSGTSRSFKNKREKSLDKLRKRQIEIEEQKLEELKKIRMCLEENNAIQRQKLEVLKDLGKGSAATS